MTQQTQSYLFNLQVQADDIAAFLKQQTQYHLIAEQVLRQRLIAWYANDRGITVSSQEIQILGNQFRLANQLEKAEDTFAWLAVQQISPEEWEQGLQANLLAQKLAEHLFQNQIEQYFAEHRWAYDRVILYELLLASPELAEELYYQIDEAEITITEAAHLYDCRPDGRLRCGLVGTVARGQIPPRFAGEIFAAQPQQIMPPMRSEEGYHLFWVEQSLSAELTPELHQEIRDRLFKEWLDRELLYVKYQ
jgi:parvulin-like peptidyl-prolyl isomerase